MNKPYLLQMETIFGCNANCIMCAALDSKRKKGLMPMYLIKKIIKECKSFGINYIIPFINGEPLLDKRMLYILSYIKKIHSAATIGWYTNGCLLTQEIIQEIINIGNIKDFNISIHGGDKKTYEKVMGLNWEEMINNLDMLVSINNEYGKPLNIKPVMCSFSETERSIPLFKKLCTDRGLAPSICVFSNFSGRKRDVEGEKRFKDQPYKLCERSQRHIYVLVDGKTTNCCFNVDGSLTFGNCKQNTLEKIWASSSYRNFREKHRNGLYKDIKACKDCNSCKFGG